MLVDASHEVGKRPRGRIVVPEFMPKQNSALIANRAGPAMTRRVPRLAICGTDVIYGAETCIGVGACTRGRPA